MKPESGETGHGKKKEIPTGSISETVLHGGTVPGIFSGYAVERGVCVPKMWVPTRIPAIEWTVSVRPMPAPGFCNSGNRTSPDA